MTYLRRRGLSGPGDCDVVSLASNICLVGGEERPCNIIRECDPLTGANHFEYTGPTGPTANANIWSMGTDGSNPIWLGANAAPSAPTAVTPPPPNPAQQFTTLYYTPKTAAPAPAPAPASAPPQTTAAPIAAAPAPAVTSAVSSAGAAIAALLPPEMAQLAEGLPTWAWVLGGAGLLLLLKGKS